jgi:hypothetical protein
MAKVQSLGEIRGKGQQAPLLCFKMCFCRYKHEIRTRLHVYWTEKLVIFVCGVTVAE